MAIEEAVEPHRRKIRKSMACLWIMFLGVIALGLPQLLPMWATVLYLGIMVVLAIYVIYISYKMLKIQLMSEEKG